MSPRAWDRMCDFTGGVLIALWLFGMLALVAMLLSWRGITIHDAIQFFRGLA